MVVAGRASGVKMVGMMEVGAPISLDGWHQAGLLVHLPLLSSLCTIKLIRWSAKIQLLGITLWATPHAYVNRMWGTQPERSITLC